MLLSELLFIRKVHQFIIAIPDDLSSRLCTVPINQPRGWGKTFFILVHFLTTAQKRARSKTMHIYLSSKSGPAFICWLCWCYSLKMTDAIIHLCLAINEKNGLSRVGWDCWGSASTFYTWVPHTPQVKWMVLSGFMWGGKDELLGQVAIIGSSLGTSLVKQ